jgi:hypothetical protein
MRRLMIALTLSLLLWSLGCSDDTQDDAQEAADSARADLEEAGADLEEAVERGGARAVAEALRAAVEADDRSEEDGPRSVDVLQESVNDLPGDPEVEGIADDDGDGLDDDGLITVRVEDEAACLTIENDDMDVDSGAC